MLSRTADHLFWMSRYTERAENTARMLDVNYQTSLLPQSAAVAQVGWQGLLSISELMPSYTAKYGHDITPRNVDVKLLNEEHQPLMTWHLVNAYPTKWSASDLNATSSAIVVETLQLFYQYFTIDRG